MARALDESVRVGAGSGHISNDGTAADRLIRAKSASATATVRRVWS
jgi:hypothetical protein